MKDRHRFFQARVIYHMGLKVVASQRTEKAPKSRVKSPPHALDLGCLHQRGRSELFRGR
jgi:hypothetical protein